MELLEILKLVAPALAVYVGIRVDNAITRERADAARASAKEAHGRLDDHINLHHVKGAGA